ncbi:MAG: sigma-70 family RNA polymerase sigma factor [Myxococcales bacterium]|nr:sigma-70 family RNA polymerase sigma factor [Myxococcales bacterium]
MARRKTTSKSSKAAADEAARLENEAQEEALDEAGEVSEEEMVAELGDSDTDDEGDAEVEVIGRAEKRGLSSSERTELARRDPLSVYMHDTKRFPLLSREEEHELAVSLVEDGDSSAARRLVESNLRLVVKIAYEYQRAHQNLLDMVQEGNVGLMQAVSKYDPYRGVKLSSYAAWWIRAYILKFILNNHRLVKVGTTQAQRKLFFNLKKEKDKLEAAGFSADAASIAKALDVREKDVVEMQKRLAAPDASFDAPLSTGDDGGVRTRHDVMEGAQSDRPDEAVEDSQFHGLLKEKLGVFADTLEGREERIFRQRWLTDEPMTLQQLGDEFGVSRERARQLEKRLLGRVREYLEEELGTAVDIGNAERD